MHWSWQFYYRNKKEPGITNDPSSALPVFSEDKDGRMRDDGCLQIYFLVKTQHEECNQSVSQFFQIFIAQKLIF